jgi:DNA-binding NarL/FixJ family response regulator
MAKISKTELLRLQKTLQTDAAIGKKFKVSRQAIHQLRQKYGIAPVTDKNDDRNLKILSMIKKGMTFIKVAEKMDLSVSQTYRIARDAGTKKHR